MRRKVIVTFLALALAFFCGLWFASQNSISAQQITPTYFTAIAGPFFFLHAYPGEMGWGSAEDKRGDPYINGYKIDVDRNRADCLHWTTVGAIPAAQLTIDPACSGGTRLGSGIYWFDAPPISTPTPAAAGSSTVSPFPPPTGVNVTSTSTPTASPTRALTGTPTPMPSPFPTSKTSTPTPIGTPASIPTLSPAQEHGFTVVCDDTGRDFTLDIWSYYYLVYTVPDEWCAPSRDGIKELLKRMAESTPASITVHP